MFTKNPRNIQNGKISLDAYPPDHAVQARNAGYFIEAIQVLHFWLEVKLQEWLLLGRHGNVRTSISTVYDSAFSIPLIQAAKALFVLGKMNKTTFDAVYRFNSMRNRVIHKLFHRTYDKVGPTVDIAEFSKAFDFGIQLSDRLESILSKLATGGKVSASLSRNRYEKQENYSSHITRTPSPPGRGKG
jgi:hypothetical protein